MVLLNKAGKVIRPGTFEWDMHPDAISEKHKRLSANTVAIPRELYSELLRDSARLYQHENQNPLSDPCSPYALMESIT